MLIVPTVGSTVVGIHGPWGSGKTTLMNCIRRQLVDELDSAQPILVDFNAWKFREPEALWRALILHLLGSLRAAGGDAAKLDELERSLYRTLVVKETGPWHINWRTLVIEVVSIALSVLRLEFAAKAIRGSGWLRHVFGGGKPQAETAAITALGRKDIEQLGAVLERTTMERQVDQVQSIEQFLERFRELMEELTRDGRKVFVFVDDLDRCLPDAALEIFEAVKLFLDAHGCNFIVAVDREVIRRGLAIRYPSSGAGRIINPDEYIEKTISVSYDVPRLSGVDIDEMIGVMELPVPLEGSHRQLMISGLGTNPRRIKRFMNLLSLQFQLAAMVADSGRAAPACLQRPGDAGMLSVYLKLLLISYRYSAVIDLALGEASLLERLQRYSNSFSAKAREDPAAALKDRRLSLQTESPAISGLEGEDEFWRLMEHPPNLMATPQLKALLGWFRQGDKLLSSRGSAGSATGS